MILEGSTVKTV